MAGPMMHAKPDEHGGICRIWNPSQATAPSTWFDAASTAIFVPQGQHPAVLNGISVLPWADRPSRPDDWNHLDLLMPTLEEPPLPAASKAMSSGVVTVEPDGRIWMISPTNAFGGYTATFPKGKIDHPGISLQANAIKEAVEESGLKVCITGYLGDFPRTTSMMRLYLAQRIGGDPTDMGWESQAVMLVPRTAWAETLTHKLDQPVLAALIKYLSQGG